MSVNDPLPWIDPCCQLIREAADHGIPVIGHCLGGQLMSKALGGTVTRNGVKEIGWGDVDAVAAGPHGWLDSAESSRRRRVFHWHGETFTIPPGATRLFQNAWCPNQAFVLGPHLAMQFHVEMTTTMIASWCGGWDDEVASLDLPIPSVQTPAAMLAEAEESIPAMRMLASQLYGHWIHGLRRG